MLRKIQNIFRQEGFAALIRRAWVKLCRETGYRYEEVVARCECTYSLGAEPYTIHLRTRLGLDVLDGLLLEECIPRSVAKHYIDHRFDLLGSGWVQVSHGMHCRGMAGYRYDMGRVVVQDTGGNWLHSRLNRSNLAIAQRVWRLIDYDYQPIDWQLDFKSGYRWSEKSWATRLTYGRLLGVDVKVPWELARMQHLPQMALRAVALGMNDPEARRLAREIHNQWLDFIATNPPGFGVNWLCPMDVAIRGANLCLAWDILRTVDFSLDLEVENVLAHSLLDHGRYIVGRLEWSTNRANHYLADICGLAFIAAYLSETQETDHWLAFTIEQLNIETLRQFLLDGGSFEGSIAYHRLSTEMVLYATALILGLPQERLERLVALDRKDYAFLSDVAGLHDQWSLQETGNDIAGERIRTPFSPRFIERLYRAAIFFAAVLNPDGSFPQIGDNDSGRFFKLQPKYFEMTIGEAKLNYLNLADYNELDDAVPYHFEDGLHGTHLLRVVTVLGFDVPHDVIDSLVSSTCDAVESRVFLGLTTGNILQRMNTPERTETHDQVGAYLLHWKSVENNSGAKRYRYPLPQQISTPDRKTRVNRFEDFGCYVFHSQDFYLLVRCMAQPSLIIGGHYHDDQLSMELNIAGNPIIRDPGSFVYTPLPDERIKYRSVRSHFSPTRLHDSIEDNNGVFDRFCIWPAVIDFCCSFGFAAHVIKDDQRSDLLIRFDLDAIEIMHVARCNTDFAAPTNFWMVPYSPGYGIQEADST